MEWRTILHTYLNITNNYTPPHTHKEKTLRLEACKKFRTWHGICFFVFSFLCFKWHHNLGSIISNQCPWKTHLFWVLAYFVLTSWYLSIFSKIKLKKKKKKKKKNRKEKKSLTFEESNVHIKANACRSFETSYF